MNSTYARQGFVIYRNLTIQNTIKNIVQFIKFNFGLEANCSEDELHFRMRSLLKKNKDEYVSTLKAIVQSPIVYEFVCNQELLSISNDLGVKSPILATSPVLHIVGEGLIIDENKVFTPWHQDVISTRGSIGQLVIWIPLTEANNKNYGLEVLPESHKLGILASDFSSFGHTVSENEIPDIKPSSIDMKPNDLLAFSMYLVHRTLKQGKFRMAISFRFNDMADHEFAKRYYYSPFIRMVDEKEYNDNREWPPQESKNYFSAF